MQERNIIHITWDGPHNFADAKKFKDESKDYGLYQIYGTHPVYGANVLLYIGKTDRQLGVRLSEHRWIDNTIDANTIQIYVGRLGGYEGTPSDNDWSWQINTAERLLIYAHCPAFNSSGLNVPFGKEYYNVHVLNWGKRRSLYPEVSGLFYSDLYFKESREVAIYDYTKK